MVESIWIGLGVVSWLMFLILTEPRDVTEWFLGFLLIIPCCAAGPLAGIAVAICNHVDPIQRT